MSLFVKNRLDPAGQPIEAGEPNRNLDVSDTAASVLGNLLQYMNIQEQDTNITLDNKLNMQRLRPKKMGAKLGLPKSRSLQAWM